GTAERTDLQRERVGSDEQQLREKAGADGRTASAAGCRRGTRARRSWKHWSLQAHSGHRNVRARAPARGRNPETHSPAAAILAPSAIRAPCAIRALGSVAHLAPRPLGEGRGLA